MTIIEAKNLKELKLDELIGSLLTHELLSKPLIREKEKKLQEDSSEEECEEEDEGMAYLVKNFTRFIKSKREKSKHESKKKKKMKESQRAQSSNKKGSSSKKHMWQHGMMRKSPPIIR
ncbi:hypothetical protein V6N13_140232 [Hibiscus sabdariffa]